MGQRHNKVFYDQEIIWIINKDFYNKFFVYYHQFQKMKYHHIYKFHFLVDVLLNIFVNVFSIVFHLCNEINKIHIYIQLLHHYILVDKVKNTMYQHHTLQNESFLNFLPWKFLNVIVS